MISAICLRSLHMIYEEIVLHTYHINHTLLIGVEGVIGFVISAVIIAILSQISCPYGPRYCAFNSDGKAVFENPFTFFEAFTAYPIITIAGAIHLIISTFAKINGIAIIHYLDSITRRLSGAVRVLVVWIVGIIVTVTLGKHHSNYVWENFALVPLLS